MHLWDVVQQKEIGVWRKNNSGDNRYGPGWEEWLRKYRECKFEFYE